MKMIDHNHFICHLILGTFTEYPDLVCLYIGRQILLIFCLALVKVHFLFRLFP